mgnify:CR=1 FL=1
MNTQMYILVFSTQNINIFFFLLETSDSGLGARVAYLALEKNYTETKIERCNSKTSLRYQVDQL